MNYLKTPTQALLTACIALLACLAAAQDSSNLPYMNPKLTAQERAADLVHRMTLEEKASQLVNQARAIPRLKKFGTSLRVKPNLHSAERKVRREHPPGGSVRLCPHRLQRGVVLSRRAKPPRYPDLIVVRVLFP